MLNNRRTAHAYTPATNIATLTAQEFIDQGTQAAAILSIAKYIEGTRNRTLARQVRDIAFEVAAITGEQMRPTRRQPRHHANNNKPVRYGWRAAA